MDDILFLASRRIERVIVNIIPDHSGQISPLPQHSGLLYRNARAAHKTVCFYSPAWEQ